MSGRSFAAVAALAFLAGACAQVPPAPEPAPQRTDLPPPTAPVGSGVPAAQGPLAPLAWLAGCWRGSVNQREFREHWLPLRGALLVGIGHTVTDARTQDYEYLRLEARADAVYYVAAPGGRNETAFRMGEPATDGPDTIFTFNNPVNDFPQAIVYRRATGGWLYVHVEGKLKGEERKIIYPFRRVDCETDAFIEQ